MPVHACKLEIPVDRDFLPVVNSFVGSLGRCYGLPAEYQDQFPETIVALVQLIMDRSFAPGDLASVSISVVPIAGGLEVLIHDRGLPFDAEIWTKDGASEVLDRVRRAVDEVRFLNLGLEGHETKVTKYFQRLLLEAEYGGQSNHPDPSAPLEIRPLRPGEALGVSRCVYRCYGYSYMALEAVYYPERLESLHASRHMLSIVAVTKSGEVGGHIALERETPGSKKGVVGLAAVIPAFRSRGLAQQMTQALMDAAIEEGIEELQAFAVTSHPYSQKLAQSFHFHPLAIYLATAHFNFTGIRDQGQRETLVGLYRRMAPDFGIPEVLYAPTRHRAMIEALCLSIARPANFSDSPATLPAGGESVIVVNESPIRNLAKIKLESYGPNWLERLKAHVRYLRQHDYRQFVLTLPLRDPLTAQFTAAIEKLGFFFAGVSVNEGGLCMVLQYLHGVTLDYDRITVVEPMAKELLSYVRVMDPGKI